MDSPVPSNQPLPPATIAVLHLGQQIDASKITRQVQGLGCKDAKDWADQYVANDPALRERWVASRSQGSHSWLLSGVLVGVALLVPTGLCHSLYFCVQG